MCPSGFIDPVWSSGVFIGILSGEKAGRYARPEQRTAGFARYKGTLAGSFAVNGIPGWMWLARVLVMY